MSSDTAQTSDPPSWTLTIYVREKLCLFSLKTKTVSLIRYLRHLFLILRIALAVRHSYDGTW